MHVRLGTRSSSLALTQSRFIARRLKEFGVECELIPIKSSGDAETKSALYDIEAASPGLFTKALEQALLDHRIDLAVHSLKDLPTEQPPDLIVAAIPEREDVSDVLVVGPTGQGAGSLPLARGSLVGTSSLRREAQLVQLRTDLKIQPIRGNVPTRLDKVRRGEFGATVLAQAGLNRLLKTEPDLVPNGVQLFPLSFVSAPGQGALCVEIRRDTPAELQGALARLDHAPTRRAVTLERRVLRELEGGCTLPLGVNVINEGKGLRMRAFLGLLEITRALGKPRWRGFEAFDISGADDETLVSQCVNHFKGFLKR